MNGKIFSRVCLVVLISILGQWSAQAQVPYFVYMQSEDNQAFEVQIGQKKYVSSSIGHCIIPGLINGQYKIAILLEESKPPQDYTIDIKDSDQGFLIKTMNGGTDYAILNMKTASVQHSGAEKQKALDEQKAKKEAEAAQARAEETARLEKEEILAAANKKASEEKEALIQKQNEEELKKREQETVAEPQNDTLTLKLTPEKPIEKISPAPKELKVLTEEEAAAKVLKEKQEAEIKNYNEERRLALEKENAEKITSNTEEKNAIPATVPQSGLSRAEITRLQEEARRIDAQGKRDSILKAKEQPQTPAKKEKSAFLDMDFTMPEPAKDTVDTDITTVILSEPPKSTEKIVPQKKDEEKKSEIKVDTVKQQMEEVLPVVQTKTSNPEVETKEVPISEKPLEAKKNPACNTAASSEEVDLIAMMIKAEKNGDEAIDLIRKIIRLKCVNTQQVRILANAFPGEEERYRVLDLCYRYTLDQEAYPALVNLLTDIYYINRFKSLLR